MCHRSPRWVPMSSSLSTTTSMEWFFSASFLEDVSGPFRSLSVLAGTKSLLSCVLTKRRVCYQKFSFESKDGKESLTHKMIWRLHRSLQASCLRGGCRQVRRAIQQVKDGSLHPATCRRKNQRAYRTALRKHRLAIDEKIRTCRWCLQVLHYVRVPC